MLKAGFNGLGSRKASVQFSDNHSLFVNWWPCDKQIGSGLDVKMLLKSADGTALILGMCGG